MVAGPRIFYYAFPNAKSVEQLVTELTAVCSGADQRRVMNALVRLLSDTYGQLDRSTDEEGLKQLRDVLHRFHVTVENRLVEYALQRANPQAPSLAPDDPLPGEVKPEPLH